MGEEQAGAPRKRKRLTYEQKQRRAELESILFGDAQPPEECGQELEADLQAAYTGALQQQDHEQTAAGVAIMWQDRRGAPLLDIDEFDEDDEQAPEAPDASASHQSSDHEASSDTSEQVSSKAGRSDVHSDLEAEVDARGVLLPSQTDKPEDDEQDDASNRENAAATRMQPAGPRRPVWEDPADAEVEVNIAGRSRLRKLRKGEKETVVTGNEYELRLRQQHAKLNPRTSWAHLRPARHALDSDDDEEEVGMLLEGARRLVGAREGLPAGRLEATRLRDANQAEPNTAVVRNVEFHPGGQILMTAGLDKRLRFFQVAAAVQSLKVCIQTQVDGVRNPKVQSIFFEDMPIHRAAFANGGRQVVATGRRKFFYVVDLGQARLERVPGLLGRPEKSFETFAACPAEEAPLLAFLGNQGCIPLFSLRSRQAIGDLKMNGSARAAAFSADASHLFTSGSDGVVHTWDLRMRRCVERVADEGALGAASLAAAPSGRLLATGSSSGVVNVYARPRAATPDGANMGRPMLARAGKPLKALMNLVTTVDTLAFSPDSQILAMASRMKRDALRLVHIPSMTAFSNWPTSRSPLQYVHSLAFSPAGGTLAIGNAKGRVLLYRLHHYAEA